MEEIWKDIDGYNGAYQISNSGNVKSIKRTGIKAGENRRFDKVLSPSTDKDGYKRVSIRKKCMQIHRLVAIYFIPNPENKSQVNHIDCNTSNNNYLNLEWCTSSENMKHASLNNRLNIHLIGKFGGDHPTSKNIHQYDLNGNYIRSFGSTREAGRSIGCSHRSIAACAQGKHKKSHGFKWSYLKS